MAGRSETGDFGEWLRRARERKGVSLRAVSQAAGIDRSLLSNLERGHRLPSDACAASLAAFYSLSPGEVRRRLAAARLIREYGPDPEFILAVAEQVREDAAIYRARVDVKNSSKRK